MKTKELEPSEKSCWIVGGDFHLLKKPGMWSGRAEIAGDDIYAMKQLADIAREYEADVILLGDTLDAVTNLPRPVVVLQSLLGPLIAEGHKVRYIQGQHEIVVQAHYENYPWLSVCKGTEHMHGCTFDFLGKRAFALDYFPQAFEALNLACIPSDTEVLFLHGTAEEVFEMSHHFSIENIPDHVRLILAGDYHEPIDHTTESGQRIVYTGSAWMRSASEPMDKYVLKVTEKAGELSIERIPLKTRPILRYSVLTDAQKHGDITLDESLPEPLQKPVVIVDVPIDAEEYTLLAQSYHAHTLGSVVSGNTLEYINIGDDNDSDEQILERYVDRVAYSSEFEFTLDLMQNSTDDALQRLREKLGIETKDVVVAPVGATADEGEVNLT